MTLRNRAFCFTLNNYSQADIDYLKQPNTQIKYLCFGIEVAPTTGTKHLQGYIYFHNPKTLPQVKKFCQNDTIHIEVAKGSATQNKSYCSKELMFFEYGDLPIAGNRTDIKKIKEMVSKGASMQNIIDEATSYQSLRTGELLIKYQKPVERTKPTVKWYYGTTGSGKTKRAFEELGYDDTWISGRNLKWWDGYTGQKNVIIDDFRGDFCTFHELLRILDRYPYRVETKGASQWLAATTIIITSAYAPDRIYDTREDIQQLLRRIDVIERLDTEVKNPDTEVKIKKKVLMATKKKPDTEVGGNTNPDPVSDDTYKIYF